MEIFKNILSIIYSFMVKVISVLSLITKNIIKWLLLSGIGFLSVKILDFIIKNGYKELFSSNLNFFNIIFNYNSIVVFSMSLGIYTIVLGAIQHETRIKRTRLNDDKNQIDVSFNSDQNDGEITLITTVKGKDLYNINISVRENTNFLSILKNYHTSCIYESENKMTNANVLINIQNKLLLIEFLVLFLISVFYILDNGIVNSPSAIMNGVIILNILVSLFLKIALEGLKC